MPKFLDDEGLSQVIRALDDRYSAKHSKELSTNQDLHTLYGEDKVGNYYALGSNNITNKPSGVDAFSLSIIRSASGYYTHILIASNVKTNTIFIETYKSGSWSEWIEIGNTDNKYLPLLGGTLTGRLVVNKAGSSQTDTNAGHIVLSKNGVEYARLRLTANNSNLAIESKGGLVLYGGTNQNGTAFQSGSYIIILNNAINATGTIDITNFRNLILSGAITVTGDVDSKGDAYVNNQFIIPKSHSNGRGCGVYETKDQTNLFGFLAGDTGHMTLNVGATGKKLSLRGSTTRPIYTSSGSSATDLALLSDVNAKYTKPSGGIPKTDLSTEVQNALNKAGTPGPQGPAGRGISEIVYDETVIEGDYTVNNYLINFSDGTDDYLSIYAKNGKDGTSGSSDPIPLINDIVVTGDSSLNFSVKDYRYWKILIPDKPESGGSTSVGNLLRIQFLNKTNVDKCDSITIPLTQYVITIEFIRGWLLINEDSYFRTVWGSYDLDHIKFTYTDSENNPLSSSDECLMQYIAFK